MAVVVTDRRTILTEGDSVTGWNTGTLVTSFFAESTGSIALALNIATGQLFFTTTAINLSNTLVYVYSFNNALQDTWTAANPPNAIYLGDGTNGVSFKMAGADRRVFNHLDGPTEWQNLVLDGSQASAMNTTGLTTVRAGSFASLNLASITQVGADFTTLSKALGGGYNTAVDIIRYGNDGLRVTAGTNTTRGNFQEIVLEDRSTATLKAHGLIRELTTGVYGIQGPLTFGNSGAATTSYFDDVGIVLAFENRNIGNNKYYLRVEGNAGATNFFSLTNSTVVTAGPFVSCSFTGGNINTLTINGNNFAELGNSITFSNLADATNHFVNNNVFNGCGTIFPNAVEFKNNSIINSLATVAMEIGSSGTTRMENLDFESAGTGHAVLITNPGTYSFNNFTFTNYGASGTTNAAVYNNSGGAVVINVSGGDSPTIRNGAGATTTVQATVTITLTGLKTNTEVRVYQDSGGLNGTEIDGVESSTTSFAFSSEAGQTINIMINNLNYLPADIWGFVTPSTSASIPISQVIDRQYFNPA